MEHSDEIRAARADYFNRETHQFPTSFYDTEVSPQLDVLDLYLLRIGIDQLAEVVGASAGLVLLDDLRDRLDHTISVAAEERWPGANVEAMHAEREAEKNG